LMEGRHRPSFSLALAQQFAKSRLKCQSCFTVITHVPTQGHNLFMLKCSAFCGHKYLMRAWSCSFVQQPVRTYISREQNSKTFFFSWFTLICTPQNRRNKTINAEKVFKEDVLFCACASRPTFLYSGTCYRLKTQNV
jgi:hypothetical protein